MSCCGHGIDALTKHLAGKDFRLKCETMVSFMVLDQASYDSAVQRYPGELADELESLYENHIRRKYGTSSFR